MNWLSSNWVWVALALGFIAFHFFGHRHGGHGNRHHGHGADGAVGRSPAPEVGSDGKRSDEQPPHKHHRC